MLYFSIQNASPKLERSLFVAGAAFGEILIDSRSAKCCIFPYKMRLEDGTSKVSEAAGELRISWQAQYFVRLEGDFACSAHCTGVVLE